MKPACVPCHWRFAEADPGQVARLVAELGISRTTARVLVARGYQEPEAARRFLYPSLQDLHDPLGLEGMAAALARLKQALAAREPLLLYGDYDADGATSLAMLYKAIELAGHQASIYVPHRLRQGYGLHMEAVEQAASQGIRLLISLDTGVRALAPIQRARQLGLDVIVVDHHLPDSELPPAAAIVNPRQPNCSYPDKNLCAAGLTFKLIQLLLGSLGWPPPRLERLLSSFLKLAAIGTVADVAPLTGENRVIVKYGLEGLRSVRNAGLRELLRVAGFTEGEALTAEQVAFRLAPRLNAAGRMADALEAVRLLLTDDEAQAREIAARLQAWNQLRQEAEVQIIQQVLEQCLRTPVTEDQAALVFSAPAYHRGVVGIVAARLVERFHRPVFVLGEDPAEGVAEGSGRSIPRFHLVEALEASTSGLGGDSEVRLEANGDLRIGPRRVVPLSLLALEYPAILETLRSQVEQPEKHLEPNDAGRFALRQRRPDSEGALTPGQREIWRHLSEGPLALSQLWRRTRHPYLYRRYLQDLIEQGLVVLSAFTPTDAVHVLGRYEHGSAEAARYGATLWARRLECTVPAFCQQVVRQVVWQLGQAVIASSLADDGCSFAPDGVASLLIDRALRADGDGNLAVSFCLRRPLVAVGAPAATYLPMVASILRTPLRVPDHAEVGNAVGAVAGGVVQTARVLVRPLPHSDALRVYLPSTGWRDFGRLEEAVRYASEEARRLAEERANGAGAGAVQVCVERRDRVARGGSGGLEEIYIETEVVATAVGRPRLGHH